MSLSITAAQRAAVYGQILDRLREIGDIELAIQAEHYEDAERLGREYCDDLQLLLDLGLGEGDGEPVELTSPPEVLRRVLERDTVGQRGSPAGDRAATGKRRRVSATSLTITGAQRDALYDQILDRLSGIGDIQLAIRADRYEDAERLARAYCDDLRLLLDDLGFGDGNGKPVELTSPPEVLRRVLPRMRDLAERHSAGQEPEWAEVQETKERNRLVSEACGVVLAQLDGTGIGGR